jgi:S-DNA-T family DNA segregation ATPase FtsK/SpoIIIE
MNSCTECDFRYDELPLFGVPQRLRELAAEHAARLVSTQREALRRRPDRQVWSPLEYACHVRDVLTVQRERILLALAEDNPAFASMEREERVEREHYNEQSPQTVATEITAAAAALAEMLSVLTDDEWRRTGIYRWPTREIRTAGWIARHTVHELIHHLRDVDAGLAAATRSS